MNPTPIVIEHGTEKTCVNFTGLCGRAAKPDGTVKIKLRKAGTCKHLIEYPATTSDSCAVCFEWGDIMWNLEPGRYVGDIFEDDNNVGFIQFQLHPQGWQAAPCTEPPPPKPEEHECGCDCDCGDNND